MINIKQCLLVSLMSCGLLFGAVACDDNEESVKPISDEDVKSRYEGVVEVGGGSATDISMEIGNNIVIWDFPVDSIIGYVVPQEYHEEALASVSDGVDCMMDFTSDIFGLNMFLNLDPNPIEFTVTYGGIKHEIKAVLYAEKNGVYNGSDYSLLFTLQLEDVILDGENLTVSRKLPHEFKLKKI